MTNTEKAIIHLDSFLRTERAKSDADSECNERLVRAVDLSEAEKALHCLLIDVQRESEAKARLLE